MLYGQQAEEAARRAATAPKTEKVFVYGTLIKGEPNAHWAGDAKREAASVKGCVYDTRWGFPAIITDATSQNKVVGEVITTSRAGLAKMDILEGVANGLYARKRVKATTASGEVVECWVYELARGLPAEAIFIKCGSWVKYARAMRARSSRGL